MEHADRLAPAHRRVGFRVIQRQGGEIDLDAARLEQVGAAPQHGQRLQAEEVELHEARLLHPLHVELGDAHAGLRVSVERNQLFQRPSPITTPAAWVEAWRCSPSSFRAISTSRATTGSSSIACWSFGSPSIAWASVTGLAGFLRHELGQLVDLPIGHFEHATDVAQHAAGEQRTEGDNLPDLPLTVALLHVADDALAALDAEVDVEIRHRDALGIQEALEQQAEAQRVEIGDEQRPRDQRACAGAAPRPDRNVVLLRPLDEVRYDQEVTGNFIETMTSSSKASRLR